MKTLNNKGMTLVEVVLAILILGIGAMMLAEGFTASARMTNRATRYRNASVAASSSIETEEAYPSSDPSVTITYQKSNSNESITIKYKEGNADKTIVQKGKYSEANDSNSSLTYKEYTPYSDTFDVSAEAVTTANNG